MLFFCFATEVNCILVDHGVWLGENSSSEWAAGRWGGCVRTAVELPNSWCDRDSSSSFKWPVELTFNLQSVFRVKEQFFHLTSPCSVEKNKTSDGDKRFCEDSLVWGKMDSFSEWSVWSPLVVIGLIWDHEKAFSSEKLTVLALSLFWTSTWSETVTCVLNYIYSPCWKPDLWVMSWQENDLQPNLECPGYIWAVTPDE